MMLFPCFLIFASGLIGGYILELVYTSIEKRRIVWPIFVNVLLYGFVTVFLYVLSLLTMPLIIRVLMIAAFPTVLEFLVGYGYFKRKGIRLWDYSSKRFNFQGFICLEFSIYWFLLALLYYYFFLSFLIG